MNELRTKYHSGIRVQQTLISCLFRSSNSFRTVAVSLPVSPAPGTVRPEMPTHTSSEL